MPTDTHNRGLVGQLPKPKFGKQSLSFHLFGDKRILGRPTPAGGSLGAWEEPSRVLNTDRVSTEYRTLSNLLLRDWLRLHNMKCSRILGQVWAEIHCFFPTCLLALRTVTGLIWTVAWIEMDCTIIYPYICTLYIRTYKLYGCQDIF